VRQGHEGHIAEGKTCPQVCKDVLAMGSYSGEEGKTHGQLHHQNDLTSTNYNIDASTAQQTRSGRQEGRFEIQSYFSHNRQEGAGSVGTKPGYVIPCAFSMQTEQQLNQFK
jgi:hypothetical protein